MKISCIQLNSAPDVAENLKAVEAFIREAAERGAEFIATPENTDSIRRYASDRMEDAQSHDAPAFFSKLANELNIWLLIGSLGVKISDTQLANRSHLFAPDGSLSATYDKIHMFDVKLSRSEFYNESKDYAAGARAVIADMNGAKLGMSICYDVRFPHLHRDLAKAGAHILCVPAAFTISTGQAHWEVLLRARAIETGCFVIAPAQVGEHEGGRKTYGHSLVVNPWGEIIAEAGGEKPEILYADIDLEEVAKARKSIPALNHDRDYTF